MLTIIPREQKVEGIEFQYSATAMEDGDALERESKRQRERPKRSLIMQVLPRSYRFRDLHHRQPFSSVFTADRWYELDYEKDEQGRRYDGRCWQE